MTTTDIALPSDRPAPAATFIGQATAVEQARAVAEVQAAIVVAQQVPRSVPSAVAQMRESCAQIQLADRAFYKYPRAGATVTGPSIHLARELARCWGNVQYGIGELRRDDVEHYSEMQAWAWDVQTNTRTSTTFVVPHKRDKRGGPEVLVELRDIYESNANMGARRVREQIFAILPPWFTAEAQALCIDTLTRGTSGRTLGQQITDAVGHFDELGISLDRLERKLGRRSAEWQALDLAQLRVASASIRQGTVSAEEEFPSRRVTADEIGVSVAPSPVPAPRGDIGGGDPTADVAPDDEDAAWIAAATDGGQS